jgi:hypothetical protein
MDPKRTECEIISDVREALELKDEDGIEVVATGEIRHNRFFILFGQGQRYLEVCVHNPNSPTLEAVEISVRGPGNTNRSVRHLFEHGGLDNKMWYTRSGELLQSKEVGEEMRCNWNDAYSSYVDNLERMFK